MRSRQEIESEAQSRINKLSTLAPVIHHSAIYDSLAFELLLDIRELLMELNKKTD